MPRVRSLLERVEIDQAGKAHNCQSNARHRINRGEQRLKVRNGRSWDHYCLECAKNIARRDIATLEGLVSEIETTP